MPRIEFKEENKKATVSYDYPKLWLKQNERARILTGLEPPMYEYVHTLRRPELLNGVPIMETKERKDGTTYQVHKMKFVTKALCLGDPSTLETSGSDPKHCPMCKLVKDHPDYAQPPQRRYAMHVIRYRTKAGSFDVANPFSVDLLVWGFTDKTFNKLTDFKEQWNAPLTQHDLLLGPCEGETFQKFDIAIAPNAAWQESDERKKLVTDTFKENQIPDLTVAIGSPKQRTWVDQDIQTVMEAWDEVARVSSTNNGPGAGLEEGLGSLFESVSRPAQSADLEPVAVSEITPDMVDKDGVLLDSKPLGFDDTDALLQDDDDSNLLATTVGVVEAAKDMPEVDNFDDLLSGL